MSERQWQDYLTPDQRARYDALSDEQKAGQEQGLLLLGVMGRMRAELPPDEQAKIDTEMAELAAELDDTLDLGPS